MLKEKDLLEEKVKSLEIELEKAKNLTADALTQNLFQRGNPVPNGLSAIGFGDPITRVEESFPKASIEKKKGYWDVTLSHPTFQSATYYFNRDEIPVPKVTNYLFFTKHDVPNDFLLHKLTAALGPPTGKDDSDRPYWSLSDGKEVLLGSSTHFGIRLRKSQNSKAK